ncbi:Ig-like domain-containing protein [Vibrio mediterranei]|nr:Ig-like domain-containing protein [Vibrio mediterranei]
MIKHFKGMFTLLVLPSLMLLTGCNSEGAFSDSNSTANIEDSDSIIPVKLERIDIIASPITTRGVSQLRLARGSKQPFEAIGHYSDGSSHLLTNLSVNNWYSSDQGVGYFNEPGILIGGQPGFTEVTATKDGVTSNRVDVDVSAAVITSIQVTPSPVNVAKGQTQQLVATATYSDSTSSSVTESVTWIPVDTDTATVTSGGLLSGVKEGNTTLTATRDGVTSNRVDVDVSAAVITSIQVTPSPVNVAKGQTQQLVATATYSDNTSSPVTGSVTWTPVDTVTVTSGGLLTGGTQR